VWLSSGCADDPGSKTMLADSTAISQSPDTPTIESVIGKVNFRRLFIERKAFVKYFPENRRATFHFYQINKDSVTLVGYKGKGNEHYEKDLLRIYVDKKQDSAIVVENPIFATQKIVKSVLRIIEADNSKYIIFVPHASKNERASQLFGTTINDILYDIYLSNSLEKETIAPRLAGKTNPSPPASVSKTDPR
jgi:hypothetical protein